MKYDKPTQLWFNSHFGAQTTVCKCDKCGLFYKPSLGHKCKQTRPTKWANNDFGYTWSELE